MGAQGKSLTPKEKETIVTLKRYFDRTRNDPEEHEYPSVQRVSHALDVSVITVKRVMADHNRGVNFEEQAETRRGHRPLGYLTHYKRLRESTIVMQIEREHILLLKRYIST